MLKVTNIIMKFIQDLCYKTEKPIFTAIQKKLNKQNLNEINLSKAQSKKLVRKLRKWSKHRPSEYSN